MTTTAGPPDTPTTTTEPPTPTPTSPGLWAQLRPLVLRLHFYAGVLVAPFLLVVSLTGLAYVFSPQLSDLLYGERLLAPDPGAPARPLDEQVAAAVAALPQGSLSSVTVATDPTRSTAVAFDVDGLAEDIQRTVYVDPASSRVLGTLDTWLGYSPLQTTLDGLHRHLLLGEPGRLYSETAASWLPVLVIGGLALWIGRRRSRRRDLVVPPATARPGRARIRGWHAVTALWLTVGLAFISVTGLTWSTYAGERFQAVVTAFDGSRPQLAAEPVPVVAGAAPITVGEAVERARAAGLADRLAVTVPTEPGGVYTVAEDADGIPVQRDEVALDPYTGAVVETVRWDDFPVLAKLTTIGISAHMGLLFGLPNQLLLAALAAGLLCVLFWGYRMAWLRRPTRAGARLVAPAPRGTIRALSQPAAFVVVLAAVAAGWLMPLFGLSLLAFVLVDAALGALAHRRLRARP
ncbi:PepSY-associated TM helix domain-containing protein [Pseudonocardia humida]|uniref:PepSY domain-containing protein n=1 Tax=Pseudonocardia humida TaxID=2800819 RepID=A0ABT1AB22_9PSEU|nr:PepSY domain-containing protein [Pseudonocardia humida]MCO1660161.1 PepSY domain-containing protein [Pseudonocardia humida]